MLKQNLQILSFLWCLGFFGYAGDLAAAPEKTKKVELPSQVENICHESISDEGIRLACDGEFEQCHQFTLSQFNKFLQGLDCDSAGEGYLCTEQAWQNYLHQTSELLFTQPPEILAADQCLAQQQENSCQFGKIYGADGCVPHLCGDGKVVVGAEECDDSNHQNGDGCSAECLLEKTGSQPPPEEIPLESPPPVPAAAPIFLQGGGCTLAGAAHSGVYDLLALGLLFGLGMGRRWRKL